MSNSPESTPALTPEDGLRIDHVVELLHQSRSLLFITGAGLSADSGLPTYRGIGGLYESLDDAEGMPIEELVSGKTMAERPELAWKHLLRIEQACRGAKPNRGHEVIAEMERAFERVWVLTQNVDGFHRLAGSRNVIDIHGDLHRVRCMKCAYSASVSDYAGFAVPPRCPDCGGILRPDVVLFGEPIAERQSALYRTEVAQRFDLVLSIGTTSVFPYISAPVLDQYHFRKQIVEINPGETEVSDFATVRVPMPAAGALDAIWREYKTDA